MKKRQRKKKYKDPVLSQETENVLSSLKDHFKLTPLYKMDSYSWLTSDEKKTKKKASKKTKK